MLRPSLLFACLAPLAALAADAPAFDQFKHAGLPPAEAAAAMTVPDGFSVTLFAGEPDVQQPIAMAFDDRGRLWVAEGHTYPKRAPEGQGRDRIVVFEDADGDGRAEKRTVFAEGLNLVSGLEVGFGGVWVGAAPTLSFIPADINADVPKPTGPPRVLLDGWGFQDTHETLNSFIWGPDGWLYGCHGVFTHSKVGRPGTPENERVKLNAGIWRFHPQRHAFEIFAEGTSNPWGVDFNDHGDAFLTSCVIPHLFHVIPGARYHRQAGQHFNPFIFEDIKTCADHLHYGSASPHAGNRRSGAFGGGHAHCGAMIYLGGSWPAEYRGQIFMNNIHGARINMDRLERRGSGYVGKHGPDFLFANDEWSQIINLRTGPDGSVFMIDWYDKQACHSPNEKAHDRSNGRIFKVAFKSSSPEPESADQGNRITFKGPINLTTIPSEVLAGALQRSANDWHVRHARRILQERGPNPEAHAAMRSMLDGQGLENKPPSFADRETWVATRQLRALWALHASGGLDEKTLIELLDHDNEWLRAWAVRLLCDAGAPPVAAVKQFREMAAGGASATVRLALASAAQKIPPAQRWDLVAALASRDEDAGDQNVPLMVWYAAEPLATVDAGRALDLALAAKLPKLLNFTARRTAAIGTPAALDAVVAALGKTDDEPKQLAILQGLNASLSTQKAPALPAAWNALAPRLSARPAWRPSVLSVAVKFGSTDALATLRAQLADAQAPAAERAAALESLVAARDTALAPVLQRLLNEPALRTAALRALAGYDDPGTPRTILAAYPMLSATERRDALGTLAARPAWARELLAAIEAATVPARDLPAELVRQMRQLGQADLNTALDRLWGAVRESPAEKQKEIAKYKATYRLGYSTPGDPRRGRVLYNQRCAQCHTLFGEGGKIGPDITGANRANLDYLLENIVTPNAVIPNDYRAAIVETRDGRVLMGPVSAQDAQNVTLATLAGPATVARADIKTQQLSETSMMPEGLLTGLADQELRDLLYYLMSPAQAPLPTGQ